MYCLEDECLIKQAAVVNNNIQKNELALMLRKCFSCYLSSKNTLAKKTSHIVDLEFAKTLVEDFHKEEEDMHRLNKILNDLKNDITVTNCLSAEEEANLIKAINEAVERGEIFFAQLDKENEDSSCALN